jgi:hypothetical protein
MRQQCCGEQRHVDRKEEVPVMTAVGQSGLNAADRAAVGMDVGNDRSEAREGVVVGENIRVRADAEQFDNRVLDQRPAGEGDERFVAAHARTAAAGEDISGDGKSVGHIVAQGRYCVGAVTVFGKIRAVRRFQGYTCAVIRPRNFLALPSGAHHL